MELVSYLYRNKLETEEYVRFLQSLYACVRNEVQEGRVWLSRADLDLLQSDLHAVQNNNVNARYIVDTWVLKLRRV